MGTDYIDLYQLHGFDAVTPAEEVLSTLENLVRAGKIRYIGCSNFSGWQLMKALSVSERYGLSRYVAHQVYYSLAGRDYEWELMPLGIDQKVGAVVWSPLGWGRLTGKIRRGQPLPRRPAKQSRDRCSTPIENERLYQIVDALDEVAKETGKTVPIALNWLLQRPTVAAVGPQRQEQLRQNLGAVGWNLTTGKSPDWTRRVPRPRSTRTGTKPALLSGIRFPLPVIASPNSLNRLYFGSRATTKAKGHPRPGRAGSGDEFCLLHVENGFNEHLNDDATGFGNGAGQDRSRSLLMAPAFKLLRYGGHVECRPASEAGFDRVVGLLDENHRTLHALDAEALVDEIFGIGRLGQGFTVVAHQHIGMGQVSVAFEFDAIEQPGNQLQSSEAVVLVELLMQQCRTHTRGH